MKRTTYRRSHSMFNGFGSAVENHEIARRHAITGTGPSVPGWKPNSSGPIEIVPICQPSAKPAALSPATGSKP